MAHIPELVVLAGGFGTRLRSVVADVPKPLAPVLGKPFLQYQVDHWVRLGIRSFTFLLYHQAELIVDFLQRRQAQGGMPGCQVRWVVEPQPLGTGGSIAHAVKELELRGSFMVTNADTWLGAGPAELAVAPAPAMAVIPVENSARYGRVRVAPGGTVEAFAEKEASTGPGA